MNNNTLLALLLGLYNCDVKLTDESKSLLRDLARAIHIKVEWNIIQTKLDRLLSDNQALEQAYQAAKERLDALSGNIPFNLLPTRKDLDKIRSYRPYSGKQRSEIPTEEPDKESDGPTNMVVEIAACEDPQEAIKSIKSFLQQLDDFISTEA
jgi:hypothetical protein